MGEERTEEEQKLAIQEEDIVGGDCEARGEESTERESDGEDDSDGEMEESDAIFMDLAGADDEPDLVPDVTVAEEVAETVQKAESEENAEVEWPLHGKAAASLKEVKFAGTTRRKAASIDLGTIEVELTFDLGTTRLSLETLESLREGYTFTIEGATSGDFVTIRANGQPIGRGSLVSVNDHLGIQIEELNS